MYTAYYQIKNLSYKMTYGLELNEVTLVLTKLILEPQNLILLPDQKTTVRDLN